MISNVSFSTSSLLSIQKAMDTVSKNIANANTDGYSRVDVGFKNSNISGVVYSDRNSFSSFGVNKVANLISQDSKGAITLRTQDSLQQSMYQLTSTITDTVNSVKEALSSVDAAPNDNAVRSVANEALKSMAVILNNAAGVADADISAIQAGKSIEETAAQSKINALIEFNKKSPEFKNSSEGKTHAVQLVNGLAESIGGSAYFNGDGSVSYSAANTAIVERDNVLIDWTKVTITEGKVGGYNQALANANSAKSQVLGTIGSFSTNVNAANATGTTSAGTPGGDLFSVDGATGLLTYTGSNAAIAIRSTAGNTLGSRFTDSLNTVVDSIVSTTVKAGSDYNAINAEVTMTSAALDHANEELAAQSGVDLIAEATKLAQLQTHFEAMAKVIQVQNSMLGTIINIVA